VNEPYKVRIRMKKNTLGDDYYYDGLVRFNTEATDGFDPEFDFQNFGTSNFSFSMPVGGTSAIVNTLGPLTEDKVVPLTAQYAGQSGTFTWNFIDVASFGTIGYVYLKDNLYGILHDVLANPVYQFEVSSADGSGVSDRFELVFSPNSMTSTNKQLDGVNFGLYPNPTNGKAVMLTVGGVDAGEAVVSVTDMLGKVVYTQPVVVKADKLTQKEMTLDLPAGVYTVQLITNGRIFKDRLVVR
jgi:hypothetical protein